MRRSPQIILLGVPLLLACQPGDDTSGTSEGGPTSGTSETGETGDSEPNNTTAPADPSTATDEPTGSDSEEDTELPGSDTDTGTDTDTDTGGPACPDGILDEGEECDNNDLSPNGPCRPGCLLNTCGDGFVHAGVESCDAGDQNGIYGGSCNMDCTAEDIPHCGDGVLQPGYESCELGDINQDGVVCQACQWGEFRYVFVTSHTFRGDLDSQLVPPNLTGVTRADTLCQVLAVGAGLPGSYYAWLSDNNNLPTSDAANRIGGDQESDSIFYVMPQGELPVAQGWSELTNMGPAIALERTETGSLIDTPAWAWTNTDSQGNSLGLASCDNWTSTDGAGWLGTIDTGPTWTNYASSLCDFGTTTHLYCIQGQDK
ncbi:MAG: hypothetical protein ACPG4T_13940 [Nannocystaceae bacterium]